MLETSYSANMPAQPGLPIGNTWAPPAWLWEVAGDDCGLIADLVESFETDTRARIERIRAALEASDYRKIQVEAHTIKGSAGQLGMDALADAFAELETASRCEEAVPVAARFDRARKLFGEGHYAVAGNSGSRGNRTR